MAPSKAGFVYPRTPGHDDDGNITWCKFVIGFPNLSTRSPEYNKFWKAMQRNIEQDRIPYFVGSTADQWAAIWTYALTVPPVVPHRAPLWQTNTRRDQRFTECFDFLRRDIARKHKHNLEKLSRIPVASPAVPATPVAAVNDRKLSQNICTQ